MSTPVSSFLARVLARAVFLFVAPVVGACNDSPPLEKASLCNGAWQPLTAPRPYDITSPLVYRDGVLYIWLLGANGTSRRLVCSPELSAGTFIQVRPAVAPDAIFAIVLGDTWQIVRIPR
jgi:hypothetical protein